MRRNRHECTKRQRQSSRSNYVDPIGHNRNKTMISPAQKEGFISGVIRKAMERTKVRKLISKPDGNQRERTREAV